MNNVYSKMRRAMRSALSLNPASSKARRAGEKDFRRGLSYEPLEPKLMLSVAGLVEVGTQPTGALSGKIIYTNPGHGFTANNQGAGNWNFQRPNLNGMIEDLGNHDQMNFFIDYVWNAGATVVAHRPVGHQTNEVILDNVDPGVTFSGTWQNSLSSTYFGNPGEVPYRFATTSLTETAVATYRPNIPEEGYYPVYTWAQSGGNRAPDQLYRINHSGGATEVTVNHRMVGNGVVYLGTFHFEAGTAGFVEISNRSSTVGNVVIADMIRFGNGMGDINRGGGISGLAREDEAALYWIQWHVDRSQGVPTSAYRTSAADSTASVSAPPRYSAYMNNASEGSLSDRVFVSFHSNAANSVARGSLALHNTSSGGATPNQFFLAQTLGREVNDDMVAQNGLYEHNWHDRGPNITYQASFNYGEINNNVINNQFDATIVETAFHDNVLDAELMRDAEVRDAIGRATYQGLVKYFNHVDGGATPVIMSPTKVDGVYVETVSHNSVTVNWNPPQSNSYLGDPALGYMVYASVNGKGFDGGTYVAGAGNTSYTFNDLDPDIGPYYFKVVAVNNGGHSPGSEVVAAIPGSGEERILIVNGFDRLDRLQNTIQNTNQGPTQRVRPQFSNTFDYSIQVASAIHAAGTGVVVDTSSNEAIIAGSLNLSDYDAVVWILGEQPSTLKSSSNETFSLTEQTLVASYLDGGGKLLVSGSEIAWDLDFMDNGRFFYRDYLHAEYAANSANTYNVTGTGDSIFAGLSFSFDNGSIFYNVNSPDVITPISNERIIDNDQGAPAYTETGAWSTATAPGYDGGTFRFTTAGSAATAAWNFSLNDAGQGEVFVQYVSGVNRTTNTVYQVGTGSGTEIVSIDQTTNNLQWVSLGSFDFTAGNHQVVLNAQSSTGGSVVIADAVMVVMEETGAISADFDGDGFVDGHDFLAWQRGFGTENPTLADGDANADGVVDGTDLAIWEGWLTAPVSSTKVALNYVGGTGGGAGIQYDSGGSTKVVNLGFPFETITTAAMRNEVMARVLEFFEFEASAPLAASSNAGQDVSPDSDLDEEYLLDPLLYDWSEDISTQTFLQVAALTASMLVDNSISDPHGVPQPLGAASGLVNVGTQPQGQLSGKIVYVHAGHGITANNQTNGAWSFQRPLLLGMIEDLGNQDQMNFFVDYLWNAGATVVPLRPVGHQPNEVIVDNVDAEVTFTGAWNNSSQSVYFGNPGEVPYRWASTSLTETAVATYRPNIPEAGYYPVYSWVLAGSDRAADQLYRVNHSGGSTEVTVNHRMVGNGLVYLGSYYFEAGTSGSVQISNRSSETGRVVIADMIRFGNGMGDITRGGGVSGLPREDEAGLYWMQWHVDRSQGVPTSTYRVSASDRDATVSAAPRQASYMNRAQEGTLSDRVFVSFHSNAGSGTSRGVLGLYNGNNNPATATPNQQLLAERLAREVNDDMVAQNGMYEHNWFNRSVVTLDRSDIEFGEINNLRINDQFDATIVETAFHDNVLDAQLMRDPKVRDAIARATYQGLVRYFNDVDGGATSVIMAPGKVDGVYVETVSHNSVTVNWNPPVANTYNGDAATGYMVYGSTNGYGFDGGTYVAGGNTTSYTFTDLDPEIGAYYFKVVAVNAGGHSPGSEVVAAIPNESANRILIVNGFNRLERFQNPIQMVNLGPTERVRPQFSNSFDYSVQVATAIQAADQNFVVDTTSNEALSAGKLNLANYQAVVWILGEESSADRTFDNVEQTLVTNYLNSGGKLFVSGSEIGWDLDHLNNGRDFFHNVLRSSYVADDAGTYNVAGAAGSIFDGLSFSFDDGSQFYDVDFPDELAPVSGSTTALVYSGGATAGTVFDGGPTGPKVVVFGFPFETITDAQMRNQVMARVLDFFASDSLVSEVDIILDNDHGPAVYTETGTWSTAAATGFDGGTFRFASAGTNSTAQWRFFSPYDGTGEVFVHFRAGVNRTDHTVYEITSAAGTSTTSVNQKIDDSTWVSLGHFDFTTGLNSITLNAALSTGGTVVIADAVRVHIPLPSDVVLDNDDGPAVYSETGTWTTASGTGFDGGSYRFAMAGTNSTAQWRFSAPFDGPAEVFAYYIAGPNRTDNTVYEVSSELSTSTASVNQQIDDATWVSLGIFELTSGLNTITLNAALSTGGTVVIADAIRVTMVEAVEEPSADFDGDGVVDGFDFLAWQRGFGSTNATPAQGDANGDGMVNDSDLEIWESQFGLSGEPLTLNMLAAPLVVEEDEGDAAPAYWIDSLSVSFPSGALLSVGQPTASTDELPAEQLFDVENPVGLFASNEHESETALLEPLASDELFVEDESYDFALAEAFSDWSTNVV